MIEKYILLLVGIVVICTCTFLISCGTQIQSCKVEAIKNGMTGDDVYKACHP